MVDDPEAVLNRAVSVGAGETAPVNDEHGWRIGRIVDPFGHEWEIGRPLGPWPPKATGFNKYRTQDSAAPHLGRVPRPHPADGQSRPAEAMFWGIADTCTCTCTCT